MAEQIKKSDVSEKDVYGFIIESAKIAEQQVKELNDRLKESATLNKTILQNVKLVDSKSLKEAENAIKLANIEMKEQLKLERDLIVIQAQKEKAQNQLNAQKEREIKAIQTANQRKQQSVGLYAQVQKRLNALTLQYRDLAAKQALGHKLNRQEQKDYELLQVQINKYDQVLKGVDATMGKHQRNVGNYASAWNGLGNSVNQLTREMPAFANSVQTGFMAISNNLPIFFDEVAKIRQQNKQLRAEGKQTTSVFKQIGGAIFSLGTALSVGVTLLTIYGSRIIEFITGTEDAAEAQERLNNAMEKGQEIGNEIVKSIEKQLNWDKLTRKQAIENLKTEIEKLKQKRENLKLDALSIKNVIDNVKWYQKFNILNLATEQIGKKQFKTTQDKVRQEESLIKVLKEKLEELQLEEYQEAKNLKNKDKKIKKIKEETKAYKDATDQIKSYFEYEEKLQELIENYNIDDTEKRIDDLFQDIKSQVSENGEIEFDDIDKLLQKEFELKKTRLKNERDLNISKAQSTKERLYFEEKYKFDLIELEDQTADKRRKMQKELNDDFENFADENAAYWENMRNKDLSLYKDKEQEKFQISKEYASLLTDFLIEQSEERLNQIEKEIQAAEKQQDFLTELAINGNIQAKQSLAENQRILAEANQKKIQEQKRLELIKSGEVVFDTYIQKLNNNDPNAVFSTIADVTTLKAFINSLQAFAEGTESVQGGVKGKDSVLALLMPDERVLTVEQNKKVGNLNNEELSNLAYAYNTGNLNVLPKQDISGNSYDIINPLIKEFQDLKKTIENKPTNNIELGAITSSMIQIIDEKIKGNTIVRNKHNIRYR